MWIFCPRCGALYTDETSTHTDWHAWLDDAVGVYPPPPEPEPEPAPDPDPTPEPEQDPEPEPTAPTHEEP